MSEGDALERLVRLAETEAGWEAERAGAFAAALRARARLVLDERVAPLEQRLRALEAALAALEQEAAWRRETMDALGSEIAGLKADGDALRASLAEASAAHERLREHHRQVVAQAIERFSEAARLPFWRFRECRAALSRAAALFAGDRA